jgi:hypothetical protein
MADRILCVERLTNVAGGRFGVLVRVSMLAALYPSELESDHMIAYQLQRRWKAI